ncbi:MAG TPA: aminoacetone oxidase family FAD-binding enzyme, partial [Clostridiaceae bacterium]|nr:aminoacetone oxidase family FAD-binding enzyme [Clostridiaceae bacterium]
MAKERKVIIIGAGASGLVAAIAAKRAGAYVILLDKNSRVGKKILATGNG